MTFAELRNNYTDYTVTQFYKVRLWNLVHNKSVNG
jgi:hypothetical protein